MEDFLLNCNYLENKIKEENFKVHNTVQSTYIDILYIDISLYRHVFKFPNISFIIFTKEFLLYRPIISPNSHISTCFWQSLEHREKCHKTGIFANDT